MAQPVIQDQQTAARAYFFCIFGMLVVEGLFQVPAYIRKLWSRGQPDVSPSTAHSKLRVILHKLSTAPAAVPFLEKYSRADYLRFVLFAAFNILFGYNRVKYTTDYKLYGWLALANSSLTLILGARNNLLSVILRIPAPVLLVYHRLIGRATLVHATLHFALTADHYDRTDQFGTVLANANIQAGLVGWVSLCIVAISSIAPIRRRFFEAFYYTHIFALVFVIGALIHAVEAKEFLLPGLLLWIADRVIRLVNNFRSRQVLSVTHHQGGVTKIKVDGLARSHPGQIAWIQVPGISFFNWHPFTIASAPEEDTATFAIRGLGGYTRKLQNLESEASVASMSSHEEMCQNQTSPSESKVMDLKMRLDGPYGTGSLEYEQYPVVALVAGGIGITPAISIASHILHRAATAETRNNRWHVHLLWTISDVRHVLWFEEELGRMDAMALGSGGRATFDLTIFTTRRQASDGTSERAEDPESSYAMEPAYTYTGPGALRQGRPNMDHWFQNIATVRRGLDVAVNLCGPRSLITSARNAAARASGRDGLFFVEEEVFEL